jgi:hypothetical protein
MLNNLTSNTYTRLTVLERAANVEGSRHAYWRCKCSCGAEKVVLGHNLLAGKTRSCGCLNRELVGARSTCTARANRIPNGTPVGDNLYKWGNAMPMSMGAICRKEKVDYLMVWRKTKVMGLKDAVYATRRHQREKEPAPTN